MTSRTLFEKQIREKVFVDASPSTRIVQGGNTLNPTSSSWICDFRSVMLDPEWINTYTEIFWETFGTSLPFQVAGIETSGIPLVTAIVMKGRERGTPVNGFFIRKSRKRDGLLRAIEGTPTKEPVILVDDLMNSGSSFRKQMKVIEDTGLTVRDLFAIIAFRSRESYAYLTESGVRLTTLYTPLDFGRSLGKELDQDVYRDGFETLWRFSGSPPSLEYVVQKSLPVLDATRVYFGTDAGTFFALNQKDGSIAWTFKTGRHPFGKGIFSSPELHKDTVYFGAYDGNVYALDAGSGTARWIYDRADWIGSSPSLAPDLGLLYVGLEFGLFRKRGGIAAVDLKTGAQRWIDTTPSLTHGSPLYIAREKLVVIGSNDGVIYGYEAVNGTLRFRIQTRGDIKTRPAYDAVRRLIVVTNMDGSIYVARPDGTLVREWKVSGGIFSSPLVHDKLVYVASLDKHLYAFNIETGATVFEFPTAGRIFAAPALYENSLWIGSNDGRLYELDPHTGSLRGTQQFSERIVNAIAYNPRTQNFFVPTVANEIYCLKRKVETH